MDMGAKAMAVALTVFTASPTYAVPYFDLTVAADLIVPPKANEGQVVFYRRGGFVGAGISCAVRENDAILTHLPPGRFGVATVAPGVHNFTVSGEASDVMRVDVHAGHTYYGVCAVQMGLFAGRPQLTLVDHDVFFAVAPQLKPVKGTVLASTPAVQSPSPIAASASPASLSEVNRPIIGTRSDAAAVVPILQPLPRPARSKTDLVVSGPVGVVPASNASTQNVAAPVQAAAPIAAAAPLVARTAVVTPVAVSSARTVTVTTAPDVAARERIHPSSSVSNYLLNSAYEPAPAEIFVRTLPPRP